MPFLKFFKKSRPPQIIEVKEPEIVQKDWSQSDPYADNVGWVSVLGGPLGRSHTGLNINPVNAMQISACFACVNTLVGDMAKLPLRMMKETEEGIWLPERNHRIAKLLKRPNRRMTQHDFVAMIVLSFLLIGNAYIAVMRNKAGKIVSLIPLIPNTVSVSEDAINGRLFYRAKSRLFDSFNPLTFTEDDMVHVRNGLSLDGGIRGASIVQLCAETLGIGVAMNQVIGEMYRNGAHLSGILTTDEPLGDKQVKQTQQSWNEYQTGIHNAGKTPVVSHGFKWQSIQQDAVQMQAVESRRLLFQEVASLFKMPFYKLGSVDKMGYNSIDAVQQDYVDCTLRPIANPIQQALAFTLLELWEYDEYKFEFDFDAMERGDLKTRTEHWHTMLNDGVFSVNTVLNDMNRKSIGPEGDIRTKPTNTGILGDAQALPMYQIDAPLKETETIGKPEPQEDDK